MDHLTAVHPPERAAPAPARRHYCATAQPPAVMEHCAVCGTEIEAGEPTETDYREETFAPETVEYEGEEYYLCCGDHREAFESEPESYT